MKPYTARFLLEVAEKYHLDVDIMENYSGRGMFGEATTAIVTDELLIELLGYAIVCAGQKCEDFSDYGFENLRVDSMGHGIVIY
jgi:hypothetical protein